MPQPLSRSIGRALSLASHLSLWLVITAAFAAVLIRPCVTAWRAGMVQDAIDRWQAHLDFHEASAPGSYPTRDEEIRTARRRLADLRLELRIAQALNTQPKEPTPWP